MLNECKKPFILICLCMNALFVTFACALTNSVGGGNSLQPVRGLRVTIEESQREELFAQFQKFAEKNDFKIEITDYGKRGKHFQVWMARDDIQIISQDASDDLRVFSIYFYGKYPGAPVDEKVVDNLLSNLRDFINEIPNVTITEEK
ncbi:MAG: hypothetical protein L0287_04615 [Anaerolineae bacterium]|nr:hypothetical protein [Anaerolineae bacterium]